MSRPSQLMNAPVWLTTAKSTTVTRYHTVDVDGLKLFYREAGASEAPALLLLHGFPTRRLRTVTTSSLRTYRASASPKRPNESASNTASSTWRR